jgi:hypothetical protein
VIIARMPNGRRALLADAGAATPATATDTAGRFKAIGYRQTKLAAADGGTMINSHGWRFALPAMAPLAASFVGMPFITAHDWGDTRARGGTITGAEVQDLGNEVAIVFDVDATAAWAIEGLANGTIDRFSIGATGGDGEIICTIHRTPVFASCWCCPGEVVTVVRDDQELELVAEWEYQEGEGLELSAVNVPAVERTGIARAHAKGEQRRELLAELSALCGRQHPELAPPVQPPESIPPSPTAAVAPAITPVASTLTAELALALGLAADATEPQIRERVAALRAEQQRTQAELDASHVDRSLEDLQRTRYVQPELLTRLRASAQLDGRAAFDALLAVVTLAASERPAAGPGRAALQSDAPMASESAMVAAGGGASFERDLDAFDRNQFNPELAAMMRMVRVEETVKAADGSERVVERRLTADDIRKHGAREFRILPNLAELAEATRLKGD